MAVNAAGGSGDPARGTWCTPLWLAKIIGVWGPDLDPCSNWRSHVDAGLCCLLENGDDGLLEDYPGCYSIAGRLYSASDKCKAFINPPFGSGQVIRWVRHYRHTNFVFLLRWAPDTAWFSELWPKCWGAWFPRKTDEHTGRVNFEPPPGVDDSTSTYPHALYLASEPTGEFLDALLENGYLVVNHERYREDIGGSGAGHQGAGGAGISGGRAPCPIGERCCEGRGPCTSLDKRGEKAVVDYYQRERSAAGAEVPGSARTERVRGAVPGGATGRPGNEVRGEVGSGEGASSQGDEVRGREVQPHLEMTDTTPPGEPRSAFMNVCDECGRYSNGKTLRIEHAWHCSHLRK